MPVFKDHSFRLGASSDQTVPAYNIPQSIRFAYGDGPYLSKAFSSAGNKKFTLSWWTKLGYRTINASEESAMFFIAYHSSGYQTDFSIQSSARASGVNYTFRTYSVNASGSAVWNYATNRTFQDPTAWYHFVVISDTDNGVASERFRLYVNGIRETSFGTATAPGSGVTPVWGGSTSTTHYIGSRGNTTNTRFDGYMAEMIYADGYAYGPEYFGKFDDFDNWIPIDYDSTTGDYGTNGFKIDGSDASNLGKNVATGNTYASFASSGLATHDQMIDTPTNNFCVLNPIDERGSGSLTQANLRFVGASTNDNVTGTIGMSSGKWYWELYVEDDQYNYYGIQDGGISATGYTEKAVGLETDGEGDIHEDDANSGKDSFDMDNGDVIGVAVDVTNKKIWWSKNGQWYSADDASPSTINISEVEAGNQAYSFSSRAPQNGVFMPFIGNYTHGTSRINFGQDGTFSGTITAGGNSDGNGIGDFKYTVPSGFLALCTRNLFTD